MRELNSEGYKLIEEFEGWSAIPYKDSVGIPTIGYGTIHYPNGAPVTMRDKSISSTEGQAFLVYEIEEKSKVIDAFLNKIGLELSDNQFSALVSFAYNVGIAPVICSGRTMNQALRSKHFEKIAEAFLPYCKGTFLGVKKVINGLKLRREKERKLFLRG